LQIAAEACINNINPPLDRGHYSRLLFTVFRSSEPLIAEYPTLCMCGSPEPSGYVKYLKVSLRKMHKRSSIVCRFHSVAKPHTHTESSVLLYLFCLKIFHAVKRNAPSLTYRRPRSRWITEIGLKDAGCAAWTGFVWLRRRFSAWLL
jgi:hypothetical protein